MALLTRYVDVSRGTNGDGSQGNPWNTLGGPNWVTMNNANEYTVYLSGGVDSTLPTGKDKFSGADISACTKLTLVGNWVGLNVENPPAGTYILKRPNPGPAFNGSFVSLVSQETHLRGLLIDQFEFTGTTHPGSNWSFVELGKAGSTLPSTALHCGVTERRANTGDTASKYPHTFKATPTSVVQAVNCVFRRKTPGSSGNCITVVRSGDDVSGTYGLTLVNCISDNTLGSTATLSPGAGIGSFSGHQNYNYTAHNCISIGNDIIYLKQVANCIATGIFNTGTGGVTNLTIMTAAQSSVLFVDSLNGDYTAVTDPPAAVVNTGYDASALIGGYTLDAYGNNRNSAAAGAAWDRGPTEYGFGAPWPDTHQVTDISQASDPECIYYGQTPAIVVGDQVSYKATTEANGWLVSIDTQGFPSVNSSGATGTDSFKFNIGRSGVWTPTPPAADTWNFSIQPTLSNPTHGSVTTAGATVTIDTNSSQGRLYIAARTAAQGGAYEEGDQTIIRDGIVGVDCDYKSSIASPIVGTNQFILTGLDDGIQYFYGFAQDVEAV